MNGNIEYKNDVFCMLMEYPENALQVYNALNNTDYTDAGLVEMKTIKGGISLSVKNDAAFIVGNDLNLYEHQSTYNPNMPIRHLIYFADIIEPYVKNRDLYSKKKIRIPVPHFVVFYNGEEERPKCETMKLSDSFEKSTEYPEIELICTVYNINLGDGEGLLDKCPILREYMTFVEAVRSEARGGLPLEEAIENAINECLKQGVLTELLSERRDEVTRMTVYDMTFEAREKYIREEGYEDGRAEGYEYGVTEGRAEGREEGRELGIEQSIRKLAARYLSDGTAKTEEEAQELAKSVLRE